MILLLFLDDQPAREIVIPQPKQLVCIECCFPLIALPYCPIHPISDTILHDITYERQTIIRDLPHFMEVVRDIMRMAEGTTHSPELNRAAGEMIRSASEFIETGQVIPLNSLKSFLLRETNRLQNLFKL